MYFTIPEPELAADALKVNPVTRGFAKAIDLGIVLFMCALSPHPLGVLMGLTYALVHDAVFRDGQSPGKRLFGLRVINFRTSRDASLRESVIRNSPIGLSVFFAIIPFWGWIILILIGLPLVGLEAYLMTIQRGGARLGDVMADTHVVEVAKVR